MDGRPIFLARSILGSFFLTNAFLTHICVACQRRMAVWLAPISGENNITKTVQIAVFQHPCLLERLNFQVLHVLGRNSGFQLSVQKFQVGA